MKMPKKAANPFEGGYKLELNVAKPMAYTEVNDKDNN
jgi:hypothetical protein